MKKIIYAVMATLFFLNIGEALNAATAKGTVLFFHIPDKNEKKLLAKVFAGNPKFSDRFNNLKADYPFTVKDVKISIIEGSASNPIEIATANEAWGFQSFYGYDFSIWKKENGNWRELFDDPTLPYYHFTILPEKINGMAVIKYPYKLVYDGHEYHCEDCPQ